MYKYKLDLQRCDTQHLTEGERWRINHKHQQINPNKLKIRLLKQLVVLTIYNSHIHCDSLLPGPDPRASNGIT